MENTSDYLFLVIEEVMGCWAGVQERLTLHPDIAYKT